MLNVIYLKQFNVLKILEKNLISEIKNSLLFAYIYIRRNENTKVHREVKCNFQKVNPTRWSQRLAYWLLNYVN